nr:site-specific integrase [Nonomuraea maritima]
MSLKEYGAAWIDERPGLRPKTVQLYEGLYRLHLVPGLGHYAVSEVKVAHIRKWRKERLDSGIGAVTMAKAYRLLKAIFATAVEDGLIKSNSCTIKNAGKEDSPERPVLTMKQVFTLADAIEPRFRILILLATFASLRWGELAALQRKNVDLESWIRVVGSTTELRDGSARPSPRRASASSASLPRFCPISKRTWRRTQRTASTDTSSSAPRAPSSGARISPASGRRRSRKRSSAAFTSMISVTPETPSPHNPALLSGT